MRLALQFPHLIHREGPGAVAEIARAAESIGFDEIDLFDHVVMGLPMEGRPPSPYPPRMPILEPLTTLGFLAGATEKIGLGTEVLVLPQRQPALVAQQVATLDTLSGGRIRLGVGVGWQECEYEALGMRFSARGRVLDEAIPLLRECWSQSTVDFRGAIFRAEQLAMEPKPPQGADLPIWIGGDSPAALRRAGRLGAGWMGFGPITERCARNIATVKRHAREAGRDPETLGFQAQVVAPPDPDDPTGRAFHADPARVAEVVLAAREAGFGWAALNGNALFLAGASSAATLSRRLQKVHDHVRDQLGDRSNSS